MFKTILVMLSVFFVGIVQAQAQITVLVAHTNKTTSMVDLMRMGVIGTLGDDVGVFVETVTAVKTNEGYALQITPPTGTSADSITNYLKTCEFRSTLVTSWSGEPVLLTDVSIPKVCTVDASATTCDYALSETCGSSGGDSGGDDDDLSAGAIVGIVIACLAVVSLVVIVSIGFFVRGVSNAPATGTIGSASVVTSTPLFSKA